MSSTWKSSLKKKYDEHRHCPVCGISVPIDKEFCSLECTDKYKGYDKKKKRGNYIQFALIGVMMVVFMFIMPMMG